MDKVENRIVLGGAAGAGLGVILIIVGVVLLKTKAEEGKGWTKTLAKITDVQNVWRRTGGAKGRSRPFFQVSYKYPNPNGPTTSFTGIVDLENCSDSVIGRGGVLGGNPCNVGDDLKIRFNPKNPSQSVVEKKLGEAVSAGIVLTVIGGLFIVGSIGGAILFRYLDI